MGLSECQCWFWQPGTACRSITTYSPASAHARIAPSRRAKPCSTSSNGAASCSKWRWLTGSRRQFVPSAASACASSTVKNASSNRSKKRCARSVPSTAATAARIALSLAG